MTLRTLKGESIVNKNTLAKVVGWLGAAITALAANQSFGKYSGLAGLLGSVLTGLGIHKASDTSAGHPNG